MGLWSFWSWFDVNWPNFDEDVHKKDSYIFVPSDLNLWSLDFKFAPLVQFYGSNKLEVLLFSYFEKIGGTGRKDVRPVKLYYDSVLSNERLLVNNLWTPELTVLQKTWKCVCARPSVRISSLH